MVVLSRSEAGHARTLEKAMFKAVPRYEPMASLIDLEKKEVAHEVKPGVLGLVKGKPVSVTEIKSLSVRGGGANTISLLLKHNLFEFDEALASAKKSLGDEHFLVKLYSANRNKIQKVIDEYAP